jgi:plant 3beta-hydroxysteroid-4alpha-carboxylate 3-dehydrogenase
MNYIFFKKLCFLVQYIIGDGNNYYDFTYVENVAYGHVCAEKTLSSEKGAKVAARKVRISLNMFKML